MKILRSFAVIAVAFAAACQEAPTTAPVVGDDAGVAQGLTASNAQLVMMVDPPERPRITVSPAGAQRFLNDTHTVVVTVSRPDGMPAPVGKEVRFTVTGQGIFLTLTDSTDDSGQAKFMWRSNGFVGTQNFKACFTNLRGDEMCGGGSVTWMEYDRNEPPVAVLGFHQYIEGQNVCTYLEGDQACIHGGNSYDPEFDVSQLEFSFDYGFTCAPLPPTKPAPYRNWTQYGVEGQPPCLYQDNGRFPVHLTVEDPDGLVGDDWRWVTIGNVAPTVGVRRDTTIELGADYAFRGGFSDPGVLDAPWNWTVGWGDGASTSGSTQQQGKGTVLAGHLFRSVGTKTVHLCVTDKDGGEGCNSTTVTVNAVSYEGACTLVRRFVAHHGIANSLCVKLNASAKAKNVGSHNGPLEAFVSEVAAQSGKEIKPEHADILIAAARALMW